MQARSAWITWFENGIDNIVFLYVYKQHEIIYSMAQQFLCFASQAANWPLFDTKIYKGIFVFVPIAFKYEQLTFPGKW